LTVRNNEVVIFGAKGKGETYDTRNWCREQDGVTNYSYSGVENMAYRGVDYYKWLLEFDAIIAAVASSSSIYNYVVAKYFEIPSSGALLIGQYSPDIDRLGFNDINCLLFTKENFIEKLNHYRNNPEKYLEIRKAGRELIKERHKISDRVRLIRKTLIDNS
jgi:spore maturation protein CgeB